MSERLGRCRRAALAAYLTVALLLTASFAGEADVKALAAAVDEHYNHLRSLQAEFTETYRGSGVERTETGKIWLKKPGMKKHAKMRSVYRSSMRQHSFTA